MFLMRQSFTTREGAVLQAAVGADETSLATGKLTNDFGESGFEIEVGSEVLTARVGFGCLVRPVAGDRVLVVRTPGGVFILSVLERLIPDSATLSLPSGGALVIDAEHIRLNASNNVSVDARCVEVRTERFSVVAESATLFGRMVNWVSDHMRISAKTQETVVDTLSVTALDRVAIVERADVLRAGSVSQTIDTVAVTSAPAVVIATSEDLRLDGKRVTVG
jgi:uncharacterized protein DUF3540